MLLIIKPRIHPTSHFLNPSDTNHTKSLCLQFFHLKEQIFVMFFFKDISTISFIKTSRPPLRSLLLFHLTYFLFLVLNFFQSVKFLSLKFIKLRNDVGQSTFNAWDDNMLDGIDTPVGRLDHLVECDEGGLQGRQLHQQVNGFLIICLQSFELLPPLSQACKLIRISTVLVRFEDRKVDSCYIVEVRLQDASKLELQGVSLLLQQPVASSCSL